MDTRLFLPEDWLTETYAARRTKCEVPADVGFQTKPQLAAAMLRDIRTAGILSCTYVVADGLYGNSPTFLDAVEEDGSTIFFVSIPSDTRCWLQGPVLEAKQYS